MMKRQEDKKTLREENAMLKRAVEELSILNDLAHAVAGSSGLKGILKAVIQRSLRALHAEQGVITLIDDRSERGTKTLIRIIVTSSEQRNLRFNEGLLGWMELHKKPLLLNNPRTDKQFKRLQWDELVHSLLCVPLIVKGKIRGVLTFYNCKEGNSFTNEDERLLTIIAAHMAHVIENARLAEEKMRLQMHIARDLHDDIASSLSSISLFTESLKRAMGSLPPEMLHTIDRIDQLAREAIETMDDIVWSISPDHDSLGNVFTRMKDVLIEVCQAKGITWTVSIPENISEGRLDVDERRALFLIFKEALHNVAKHSHARSVHLAIELKKGAIDVVLKDDGVGVELQRTRGHGHGLRSMVKRSEEIGAKFSFHSEEGKGTEVRFSKKMT